MLSLIHVDISFKLESNTCLKPVSALKISFQDFIFCLHKLLLDVLCIAILSRGLNKNKEVSTYRAYLIAASSLSLLIGRSVAYSPKAKADSRQ